MIKEPFITISLILYFCRYNDGRNIEIDGFGLFYNDDKNVLEN